MIIEPKIRGFVCVTAHPTGCARHVAHQIEVVRARGPMPGGPKRVRKLLHFSKVFDALNAICNMALDANKRKRLS